MQWQQAQIEALSRRQQAQVEQFQTLQAQLDALKVRLGREPASVDHR